MLGPLKKETFKSEISTEFIESKLQNKFAGSDFRLMLEIYQIEEPKLLVLARSFGHKKQLFQDFDLDMTT